MASITNQKPKFSIGERAHQLSQKISEMPFMKPQQTIKKYEIMERTCNSLESELEQFKVFMDQKMLDIKQTNKITQEIKKDHTELDTVIRQQIAHSSDRMMLMIDQKHSSIYSCNKDSINFIDHQSNKILEAIQIQENQAEQKGNAIRQALRQGINEIQLTLKDLEYDKRLEKSAKRIQEPKERLQKEFKEMKDKHSNNESQFYERLRDTVKNLKQQLQDDQQSRQMTESKLLNILDKIRDRAMIEDN